ncbi:MAG: hypothetical protein ACRDF4_04815 [Rhabdochlamydiaceae bacterium]
MRQKLTHVTMTKMVEHKLKKRAHSHLLLNVIFGLPGEGALGAGDHVLEPAQKLDAPVAKSPLARLFWQMKNRSLCGPKIAWYFSFRRSYG